MNVEKLIHFVVKGKALSVVWFLLPIKCSVDPMLKHDLKNIPLDQIHKSLDVLTADSFAFYEDFNSIVNSTGHRFYAKFGVVDGKLRIAIDDENMNHKISGYLSYKIICGNGNSLNQFVVVLNKDLHVLTVYFSR